MRLLIVGPLEGYISAAGKIALSRGATVAHVDGVEQAMTALRAGQGADLVMMDVKLDIALMVDSLRQERFSVPLIACGIGADAAAAVRAIKAGAKEYLPLPPDAEMIAAVLQAVAQESHVLLYRDIAMENLVRLAEQVAPSEASILITGESGTGKEVLARLIHRRSRRARHNFISVNCAAIPENLLESELFGHEKGAFTGAIARRIGKFEEATGGTMLLDEVSEMHPRLQAKLLRAVQEREIDRVGGLQPIKIDIRLIATSNRDIEDAVRKGEFREDLYFRLNVVNLRIPALRERPRDIGMLAEHFLKKYAEANELPVRPLTAAAQDMLAHHSWRGNVRELENTMHRAVLLAQGDEIGTEAVMLAPLRLSDDGAGSSSQGSQGMVGRTVADVERDLILSTLQHYLGNRTHAANILGISIRTLRNKLQQYRQEGMVVPHPGEPERASA
jgi:two-component system, response regulator FlrC